MSSQSKPEIDLSQVAAHSPLGPASWGCVVQAAMVSRLVAWRRLTLTSLMLAIAWGTPLADAFAQEWVDSRQFGPFACYAEFPLAEYDSLFQELASTQRELLQRLRLPPVRERIVIHLFASQGSYRRYMKQHLPDVPFRRALFYKASGPGMVFAYRSSELEVDVRHECTHALLHASLPMVPLWLDEGLAEYFEVPAAERVLENPHHGAFKWNLRLGMVPELKRLEDKSKLEDMGRSEYRYSWAWAHYLLNGPQPARDVLLRYIADVRSHSPPGRMSERLSAIYADPEGAMVEHFKRLK